MSKRDIYHTDSDLIKEAFETVTGSKNGKPDEGRLNNRGRRYSKSEKQTILNEHSQGKNFSELLKKHGVCRETLMRWLRREKLRLKRLRDPLRSELSTSSFQVEGKVQEVKEPQKSIDQHEGYHPNWKAVLHEWRSRPGLGPAQIRNQLYRAGTKINVATVRKIMEENGYTPPKTTIKEVLINRYEAVRPLEIVHMDFKHFYINRQKVYLLLFQDDFSRFLCGFKMTDSENMNSVIEVFEECINRYGKMQSVMTDAGSAFYSWNGVNRFQKLLSDEYGIDQIKAKTPRSNGKIENVNKQIEKEILDVDRYASLEEAKGAIQDWIRFYNFERTHLGLPLGTVPADRFLPGWNEQDSKNERTSILKIASDKELAWKEVLKLALRQIKRAA